MIEFLFDLLIGNQANSERGTKIGILKSKIEAESQKCKLGYIFNRKSNLGVPTDTCAEIMLCRFLETADYWKLI